MLYIFIYMWYYSGGILFQNISYYDGYIKRTEHIIQTETIIYETTHLIKYIIDLIKSNKGHKG